MKIDKRTMFYKWVKSNFDRRENGIYISNGRPREMINMFTIDELIILYVREIMRKVKLK